ncbi:MAG: alpha/beta fold hydrolase [Myxococcota bacterium]
MVHGNPTWSFYYRNLIGALRPSYRAIALDHIGCGLSDKPAKTEYNYTLAQRVADLDRLIEHLQLEKFTLIVHDWGGMIGFAWAAAHPERLANLVVMNTAAFPLPAAKRLPLSLKLARTPGLGALLVRGLNAFSRGAVMHCTTKALSHDVAQGYLRPYNSWANRLAVHRFVQDIPLSPKDEAYDVVLQTQQHLGRLKQLPMLLCWGMQDFVFDSDFLEVWEKHFPEAQAHRFADAGHYVLEDAGQEIQKLIEGFLGNRQT